MAHKGKMNQKEKMKMINQALADYDEDRCDLIESKTHTLRQKMDKFDDLFLNYCRKVRAVLDL
jgi:hypothetical protein